MEVHSYHSINRVTGLPDIHVIPEKYRGYILLTEEFIKWYNPEAKCLYTAQELIQSFPSWEYISDKLYKDELWSKEDHHILNEFLLWLSNTGNWLIEFK